MRKLLLAGIVFFLGSRGYAANYSDLQLIANDSNFQGRVTYAMESAAIAVINESTSTVGHIDRVNYARTILHGGMAIVIISGCVLTNPSIAAEADKTNLSTFSIPDSDIQFQVNSIYNALAGIQ